jgi:menaquinone-dependent protoporphyrinogen oxidase
MNVLVAYATRLGSTEAIAERIAGRLEAHRLAVVVRPVDAVDTLTPYDAVVIGSAVYAGRWLTEATEFVGDLEAALSARPTWLFSSGPVGDMAASAEPVRPAEVLEISAALHAKGHRTFGGALDRRAVDGSDLGFADRFLAKHFVAEGDYRDWDEIDAWADEIASDLAGTPAHT